MKKVVTIIGVFILFLQSGLVAKAQEGTNKEKSNTNVEAQIDEIMNKYIGKEIPGASIGIVKDGEVVLTKGYGVSDIEKKTPVTADTTVFEVGSVTKLFTWSMLMKLAEEGKVKLDADIQDYLPEGTLNLAFDKKITILDLMHHTAGFEESPVQNFEQPNQIKPLKELITKENQPKQVYEPGTIVAYSNYGADLAGYIIEQVTGQDYISFMNKNMLELLQMNQSTFSSDYNNQPVIEDNMSLGYEFDKPSFIEGDPYLSNDVPAGALKSTATDMTHFMLALLNYEGNNPYNFFKQTRTLKEMQAHSYEMIVGATGSAHGFLEKELNGKRVLDHGGNTFSFSSQFSMVPEDGNGYILLTNVANEATGIQSDLETLLYGNETDVSDLLIKKSSSDQKVVGNYRTARTIKSNMAKLANIFANTDIGITASKDGGINVKLPGNEESTLYVEVKPGTYQKVHKKENDTGRQYLYFDFDENGQVIRMGSGSVKDFLPVPVLDTQLFNFTAYVISFLIFLGSLLYLLIKFIVQKFKKRANRWSLNYTLLAAFSTIGLLVMISGVVLIIQFTINQKITSSMHLLFYFNWLLPLFTVGLIIWLAIRWRKYDAKVLTILLILIGLLTSIQFYNVHLFF